MKGVLFIIVMATFTVASAQNNNPKPLLPKPKTNSLETPRFYVFTPSQPRLMVPGKLTATLPNGNKVYALSQDNMPCIVPDMSQYNMPVARPRVTYTIPNPALPQPPSHTPTVLSEEQLKKLIEMQRQGQLKMQ